MGTFTMGKKVTTKPVVASEPSGSTLFSARKQGSLDPNLASLFSQSVSQLMDHQDSLELPTIC